MISDDDSHIRRNIVLISSGILLAAWLELPGTSLMASILPAGFQIEPSKLWAVGFALLGYLGVRYQFSADGLRFKKAIEEQVRDFRYGLMIKSLNLPAKKVFLFVEADSFFPGNQLSPLVEEARHSVMGALEPTMPQVYIDDIKFHTNAALSAGIRFQFEVPGGGAHMGMGRSRPLVSWRQPYVFFKFSIPASLRGWIYSPAAVQYMAPIGLAIIAEIVLGCRLVAAYWAT